MAQFNTVNPRTIADELRVIRKALRRIQAHENHEALKALEDVKRMAEEAKSRPVTELPTTTVTFRVEHDGPGWVERKHKEFVSD